VQDLVFGLVAIAAGALFCFAGYLAFRIVIPLWAAFVGFGLGAGVVASVTDDGFLRTGVSWLVGLAVALAFALLAYLFYELAVVIAMGSIGFALGTGLMVALDVEWTWLVVLVGVVLGLLLAVGAILADLPMLLLVVLGALGGASAMTTGAMLLVGAVDTEEFTEEEATEQIGHAWWWSLLFVVLAVAGLVVQLRSASRLRQSTREAWATRGA
jgi:hypothetical protein